MLGQLQLVCWLILALPLAWLSPEAVIYLLPLSAMEIQSVMVVNSVGAYLDEVGALVCMSLRFFEASHLHVVLS